MLTIRCLFFYQQLEGAQLSPEERRSLRAKRNRESAEKSRVRRKVQTAELEKSVAGLRNDNESLKGNVTAFRCRLESMCSEVTKDVGDCDKSQALQQRAPVLYDALKNLSIVLQDCPRTFHKCPRSPEIKLRSVK